MLASLRLRLLPVEESRQNRRRAHGCRPCATFDADEPERRFVSRVDDDRRFADELRPFWVARHYRLNRELAALWVNRVVRDLLVEILRREGLEIEATRLQNLPPVTGPETADAVGRSLFEVAQGIDEHRAVAKSVDAAIMVLAARDAAATLRSGRPDSEKLHIICLRLRQLARAARRLDEESQQMFVDLADA